MDNVIGTFEPAAEYIHPEMQPIVDALFSEDMVVEAYEVTRLSIEYAQRLKYAARLIGHEATNE